MIAKCSKCDACWRVRGMDDGQDMVCPFCNHHFKFTPVADDTVFISTEEVEAARTTAVGGESEEIHLSKLAIPSNIEIRLEFLNGSEEGRTFIIEKSRTTFGRGAGDIEINDPQVSRKHAVIEVFGNEYIILRDMASTNGTMLNNRLVSSTRLADGDIIKLGLTEIKVSIN